MALAGTVPAASLRHPSWIVRLPTASTPRAPRREIERRVGGRLIVDRPGESLEREIGEMRPIVYGVTALLLAIAGRQPAHHAAAERARAAPRRRHPRRRRRHAAGRSTGTVVAGGLLLAVPSVLVGLPLGAWLFTTIVGITDPSDGPDVATLPSWWSVSLARARGAGRGGGALGPRRPRGRPRGDRRRAAGRVTRAYVFTN